MNTEKTQQSQNGQSNARKTHSSQYGNEHIDEQKQEGEELIKRTEVHNSPFMLITINNESFICLGKYRITEIFKTEEEALQDVEKITWNRIIQVIQLLTLINTENEN